ncbi:MAG: hypothetical protein GQ570_01020 [Helicobacteraceae bacterium]|nr:hypothetical protein [Helicobacteraceae bacterium]
MDRKATIEKILNKKIKFYKKLTDSDKEELWGIFSDYEIYTINLKVQKKIGFGKNKFTLEEYRSSFDVSKYKSLKEWDKEQYIYQKKRGQTNLDEQYKIYLFGDWCKLIENKKLIYGTILSVHTYIYDQVIDELMKFENHLYPHTIDTTSQKEDKKRTNPLTKKKEYFYTMDFTTKAYGRERKLKKLQKFISTFKYKILYPKIKEYVSNHLKNRTYRIVNKKDTFDNSHQFLFSDKQALKNCTFKNFLTNFNELKRDTKDLKDIEKKFIKYSKNYILENHFNKKVN